MDYKDTLLMPKTSFEMRGDLPEKDKNFIKFWDKINLYNRINIQNQSLFILHDGPPYANGDLHMGHALNKILKDIIVRHQALNGKKVDFRPGWDTHGLPIEIEVQKAISKTNNTNLSKIDYLKMCYNYAISQVNKQQQQFKKFGLIADFSNRYLTLDKKFVTSEIEIFHKTLNKKMIYQDLKPVYWSWSSKTALAEAEIEYTDVTEKSIFVKFFYPKEKKNFLIWTTTPWTLNGNVGVAVNKDIEYVSFKINDEEFVMAKSLIEELQKNTNREFTNIKDINIKKYINKKLINPINNNFSRLVFGHHVTDDSGTGLVHIAGGHGQDDYMIVKENKLPLIVVMDDSGKMINSNQYDGLFYLKANEIIINDLTNNKSIFWIQDITHSIPIDWRTKKPVVYRATKQWFFSISKIKNKLTKELKDVEFLPKWGQEKLIKMIENRDDWCISRQRMWGVPIPIIYDKDNNPIVDIQLQKNIEDTFLDLGIFAWYEKPITYFLPSHIPFDKKMRKETDILDVWFDSGSSNYSVLSDEIADIYLEGTDQLRGWFNSSLILGYITKNKSPYKKVIIHGFITDEKGNKMSKSIGNVQDPLKIINQYGLDILRLWVASNDYFHNVKISTNIIMQNVNDYRKIRNTIKFLLGNINDYQKDHSSDDFCEIDSMILNHLQDLVETVKKDYENYNFAKVLKLIISDITSGGIAYYLDYSKDILYIEKKHSKKRLNSQYILNKIYLFLAFYLSPIIPVTIEESFQIYENDKNISVFLYNKWNFKQKTRKSISWKEFNYLKLNINKEIEILREKKIANNPSQLLAIVTLNKEKYNLFKKTIVASDLMLGELIFELNKKDKSTDIKVEIKKLENTNKCQRCWKWYKEKDMQNNEICNRCHDVLN